MSEKYNTMLLGGTLTMIIVSALLMSDSLIAGIFVGRDAVAGITQVTPLYSMAAFFGSLFSIGIPIIYSNELGRFREKEASQVFGFGLIMSLTAGIALFVIVTIFGEIYLSGSNREAAVFREALSYLGWMRFSIMVLPVQMFFSEMVYTDGDEAVSAIGNIVQGTGNIAASILLARVMGVAGIGLASFIFNLVALAIFSIHFMKKSNSLKLNLYFSPELLKKVVSYSIIDASSYLFIGLLTAVLNAFVNRMYGADYLVLVSVVAMIREMQMVFDGIGEAIMPILSVYFGEDCYDGVRKIWNSAGITAAAEGIAVTILLVIFAPFIPKLLDITDPAILAVSIKGIRIMAWNSVLVSFLYLLTSYYLIARKIALGLVISALRDVLIPAPFALAFGLIWNETGMFAGLAAAPALAFILSYAYVASRYGRDDFPLLLNNISRGIRSRLFDLTTDVEEITEVQKKVAAYLEENNYDSHITARAKLLTEEIFMLIREKNSGRRVLCECAVILKPEGIQIIARDNGVLFDISKEDVPVTSLLSLVVSSYMERLGDNKKHLKTMSFNRTSFFIETEQEAQEKIKRDNDVF